jgi:hypothetical protein
MLAPFASMARPVFPYAYWQHIDCGSEQKAHGVRRGKKVQAFASSCIQKRIFDLDL